MADVKGVNMHKRMAQGEKINAMKKGGAVKGNPDAKAPAKMNKGGKMGKRGC